MKRALRYPSRWAGCWRTLGITAVLSVALGACSNLYGARDGTIEYPGSGAGPAAAAVYVVKEKDTVESVSQRYGVPVQTIIDRNRLIPPYTLRPGQSLQLPNARFVPDATGGPTTATATAPGPVKRESLPPPGQSEPPRLVQSGRFAEAVIVADEHTGCCVIGSPQQVRVEVLLLHAPVRHEHRRLGRQVHPVLDPSTARVLTHTLIGVSLAMVAPRLAGDRIESR